MSRISAKFKYEVFKKTRYGVSEILSSSRRLLASALLASIALAAIGCGSPSNRDIDEQAGELNFPKGENGQTYGDISGIPSDATRAIIGNWGGTMQKLSWDANAH